MRSTAFGLEIATSLPLPGHWPASSGGLPLVMLLAAEQHEIERAWTGFAASGWRGLTDGGTFVVEHGRGGDLRMRLESSTDMHLSSDGGTLLVASAAGAWTHTVRVMLDSALFTVSLRHGNEALHAGAVALDGTVIAIAGDAGAGKSSLVQALLDEGCAFFTDDVLAVRGRDAQLLGFPGPPLMTLPTPRRGSLGTAIADLDGETWVAVDGTLGPLPLGGLVLLGESGSGDVAWHELLLHLLRFPRTRERERARFELAADLAARIPALRVPARNAPPAELARHVVEWARRLAGGS